MVPDGTGGRGRRKEEPATRNRRRLENEPVPGTVGKGRGRGRDPKVPVRVREEGHRRVPGSGLVGRREVLSGRDRRQGDPCRTLRVGGEDHSDPRPPSQNGSCPGLGVPSTGSPTDLLGSVSLWFR